MLSVMHIHFWGNAATGNGSVEKVLLAFSAQNTQELQTEIASCGVGAELKINNATYSFFQESKVINSVFNKLLGLKVFTYPSLIKLINKKKPDILHFHNRQNLVDRVVGKLEYHPKVLVHYHRHFGSYHVPSRADLLVTVSESVKKDLAERTRTDKAITVVYNPTPVLPAETITLTRKEKPVLLYGGGHQAHKGFIELEAALLRDKLAEKFEIVLCGPKFEGYTPPFEAKVLGLLASEQFMDVLKTADIVVMPSHHEGFSILALEVMSLGKLLISSGAGGLGEISNQGNSILCQVSDSNSLHQALLQAHFYWISNDRLPLNTLIHNAIQTVQDFMPTRVNKKLAVIYKSIKE